MGLLLNKAREAGIRPEIQTLRAVAVIAVVIYHLWPGFVGSGFAGVDMFFAISGFLITAHLVREVVETGRVDVPRFWSRRIRRLLPAALLVLLVASIGIALFVPRLLWAQFFREIGASALYIENWALAADSVDYLASKNVASPAQHYWSLSVEEQFYFAWPLIMVIALLIAKLVGSTARKRFIAAALLIITAGSLVLSIVLTADDPDTAYFSTFTRAWEFGAGGLLAIFAPAASNKFPVLKTSVAWIGWALIGYSLLKFSAATEFPGSAALVPVLGTLAVIWAGSEATKFSPTTVGALRPIQFVGDISYSVYLWHWPLILLAPFVLDAEKVPAAIKGLIVVITIVLAWMSKRFVEDPVRSGVLNRRRPRWTFAATVVAMSIVVGVAAAGITYIERQAAAEAVQAGDFIKRGVKCFGAAALDPQTQPCDNPDLAGVLLPSVPTSDKDFSAETWKACASVDAEARECVSGTKGGTRVALLGDSHAHAWLPALEDLAASEGWELHMFVKGGCSFSTAVRAERSERATEECAGWNESLQELLASQEPFELAFTAQRSELNRKIVAPQGSTPKDAAIAGFEEAWQPLIERGTTIVGIRGVRDVRAGIKECVEDHLSDIEACAVTEKAAMRHPDFLADAASTIEGARLADLTSFFCVDGKCPAVIGSVLVHRDGDHITRTFARTLAPYLLREALD